MREFVRFWQRPFSLVVMGALVLVTALGVTVIPGTIGRTPTARAAGTCDLHSARGDVQHVIYVQFDNTHFTRDNPNVPSDLEQMPHLLNFIEQNGVLLSNHHTPLISHTATDILTSLTGVYGDRHGVPVANSFRYFTPSGTSNTGVSFAYWTSPVFDPSNPNPPIDTTYNMLTAQGTNAPAPWVPYTRAGCNVGSVATANTILENIGIDIPTVFGANSPEAQEAQADPNQATADFVGLGIHCATGGSLCSDANNGKPDLLAQEPGGYSGFNALYGNKYVAPQISPNGPMTDLDGNVIQSPTHNIGFPGFDGMSAGVSLSYVAAMQEHGVPVTYAYISDAHDAHPTGPAFGPGSAGYVAALAAYDSAFAKFFARLAADGINRSNTLFVFTADEGDHFAGGTPSPAGCDGVTTPCTYSQIGEINANLAGLLATEKGITTPFRVHSDSAPTIYITGNPAPGTPTVRTFEQGLAGITAVNPMTGQTDTVAQAMADPVEMKLLHMITADPARTATLTMFADPNYFLFAGAPNCNSPCVTQQPGFAWNHGDFQPDITTTWLGMVGPGVRHMGVDHDVWSDHTDVRPTMMMLLGLQDDYAHDGRALFEVAYDWAVPLGVIAHRETLRRLAATYKQLNACVGQFGLDSLKVSTTALASNSPGDATYVNLEGQLATLGGSRDALAAQMSALLEGTTFGGQAINEQQALALTAQGQALLDQMRALAGN
ncbi:MAG TPA: hypothetical protein VFU88_02100 [Ktedonobacterales bacterium]|nr:hypothetical protein [Ktedonobacterales bacterium]